MFQVDDQDQKEDTDVESEEKEEGGWSVPLPEEGEGEHGSQFQEGPTKGEGGPAMLAPSSQEEETENGHPLWRQVVLTTVGAAGQVEGAALGEFVSGEVKKSAGE